RSFHRFFREILNMLNFTDWEPDRFRILHEQIENVSYSASETSLKEIGYKLQENKSWFINLLELPPQQQAHRDQLKNKGIATINRTEYKFSESFVVETNSLSDFLKIDEFFAACLLHHGSKQCSKFNRSAPVTAVLLLLREQAYLLVCLSSLIGNAYNEDVNIPARELFKNYVDSLFSAISKTTKGSSFARKLLLTIQKLKAEAIELDARLQKLISQGQTVISRQDLQLLNAGYTLVNFNTESIKDRVKQSSIHQRYLAHNLWLISYNYLLNVEDIKELTKFLRNSDTEDIVFPYLIASLLSTIDTSSEHLSNDLPAKQKHDGLVRNKDFINDFTNSINKDQWKVEAARATIMIQWCLFVLEALRNSSTLESQLIIKEEHLGEMFQRAVVKDAFQFITHYLLSFQKTEMEFIYAEIAPSISTIWETNSTGNSLYNVAFSPPGMVPKVDGHIQEDFGYYLRKQLEFFVISIVTKMWSNLQRIRRQEEDAIQSAAAETLIPSITRKSIVVRHDVEAFFVLIANIYRNHPDEGLRFWIDLKQIINWGASFQEKGMMRAYLEMLCSLSTGVHSSSRADDFLLRGSEEMGEWCSWSTLFRALNEYNVGMNQDIKQILEDEIKLLISFLRIFQQVVRYSSNARIRFFQANIIKILFRLVTHHVPTELKAELYNSITAFCVPETEGFLDIVLQIWYFLEEEQIVHTVPKDLKFGATTYWGTSSIQAQDIWAIKKELEEVESPKKLFFQTLSFVRFISSLIYVPDIFVSLRCGFPVRSPTMIEQIGTGYRQPGITPYINFIIDDIFIKAPSRDYIFPSQKWNIMAASLDIIEKCLISFDLTGPLFQNDQTSFTKPEPRKNMSKEEVNVFNKEWVQYLRNHPGYDIMKRLLSNTRLVDVIFEIFSQGIDALGEEAKAPFILESVLHCLRILLIALEKQERFTKNLIPLLGENSPGYLENAFLSKKEVIVQIALLLHYGNADVCLYVVKVLSNLARSSVFNSKDRYGIEKVNRLVGILDSSADSEAIIGGFVMRLELNGEEDVWDNKYKLEDFELTQVGFKSWSIPGEDEFSAGPLTAEPAITFGTVRCAILDLILENMLPGKASPTISHFLLGFDLRGSLQTPTIKYINQDDLRESCLHKIMEILGQPINDESDTSEEIKHNSLLSNYPSLAACCYQILYRLCADFITSDVTMLFLRSQGFIYKQFRMMPLQIVLPEKMPEWGELCKMTRYDNQVMELDLVTVCANLDERTYLMKMIALELRKCQTRSGIERLLAMLLGVNVIKSQAEDAMDEDISTTTIKILDILNMLEFDWDDLWQIKEPQRNYFDKVNFKSLLTFNERGFASYRLNDVFSEMNQTYIFLRKQAQMGFSVNEASLRKEMKHILRYCYFYNRDQEYIYSRRECFKAWREVIEVTIVNHYSRLRLEVREATFHDILSVLLPTLQHEARAIAEIISKVIFAAITVLRLDRKRLSVLQTVNTANLAYLRVPSERLFSILRLILECLVVQDFSPDVRNNLYATIYNYLHYIEHEPDRSTGPLPLNELSRSLSKSAMTRSVFSTRIPETTPRNLLSNSSITQARSGGTRSILDAGNLAVFRSVGDRLLDIIRIDASEGPVAGKLCALNVLTAICSLDKREKGLFVIDYMIRSGFLGNVVKSLKSQNELLLQSINPRHETAAIQAKYVFEARMGLLICLAQRRDCAIKLLDIGIIDYLDELAFLDERPNYSNPETESFGKPAYKSYHDFLMLVVRLIVCILTSVGHDSAAVLIKVSKFISGHQGLVADIFTDVPPIDVLYSQNFEKRSNFIMCIEVLSEVTRLFYILGDKIKAIDSARIETHQCTYQTFLKELMTRCFTVRKKLSNLAEIGDLTIQHVKEQIESINRNLLGWCQIMTSNYKDGQSFTPIFTPSLDAAKRPDDDYHGDLRQPELSVLVNYLRISIDFLEQHLQNLGSLSAKIEKGEEALDNTEEVLASLYDDLASDLDDSQRRSLAMRTLQEKHYKISKIVSQHLYDVEISLLLLWRHLDFMIPSRQRLSFDASTVLSSSVSATGDTNKELLRKNAKLVLSDMLIKLESLDQQPTTKEIVDRFKARNDYIQMLFVWIITLGAEEGSLVANSVNSMALSKSRDIHPNSPNNPFPAGVSMNLGGAISLGPVPVVSPNADYAYKAKALYDYQANPDDQNEISFTKGEILDIVDNKGKWWQAKKVDGTIGIAPSNYLELI
ncbi:1764_t:CDS:10, partial [Acaulospora morrowiae]